MSYLPKPSVFVGFGEDGRSFCLCLRQFLQEYFPEGIPFFYFILVEKSSADGSRKNVNETTEIVEIEVPESTLDFKQSYANSGDLFKQYVPLLSNTILDGLQRVSTHSVRSKQTINISPLLRVFFVGSTFHPEAGTFLRWSARETTFYLRKHLSGWAQIEAVYFLPPLAVLKPEDRLMLRKTYATLWELETETQQSTENYAPFDHCWLFAPSQGLGINQESRFHKIKDIAIGFGYLLTFLPEEAFERTSYVIKPKAAHFFHYRSFGWKRLIWPQPILYAYFITSLRSSGTIKTRNQQTITQIEEKLERLRGLVTPLVSPNSLTEKILVIFPFPKPEQCPDYASFLARLQQLPNKQNALDQLINLDVQPAMELYQQYLKILGQWYTEQMAIGDLIKILHNHKKQLAIIRQSLDLGFSPGGNLSNFPGKKQLKNIKSLFTAYIEFKKQEAKDQNQVFDRLDDFTTALDALKTHYKSHLTALASSKKGVEYFCANLTILIQNVDRVLTSMEWLNNHLIKGSRNGALSENSIGLFSDIPRLTKVLAKEAIEKIESGKISFEDLVADLFNGKITNPEIYLQRSVNLLTEQLSKANLEQGSPWSLDTLSEKLPGLQKTGRIKVETLFKTVSLFGDFDAAFVDEEMLVLSTSEDCSLVQQLAANNSFINHQFFTNANLSGQIVVLKMNNSITLEMLQHQKWLMLQYWSDDQERAKIHGLDFDYSHPAYRVLYLSDILSDERKQKLLLMKSFLLDLIQLEAGIFIMPEKDGRPGRILGKDKEKVAALLRNPDAYYNPLTAEINKWHKTNKTNRARSAIIKNLREEAFKTRFNSPLERVLIKEIEKWLKHE